MPEDIQTLPVSENEGEKEGGSVIQRISHRHEQIINWLLQNPHRSLRECADEFNYSQGWLSQLIHSDIFQAQLRSRQDGVFVQVAQDIPTKLKGLADQAIEKVSEILERTEEPGVIIDVFDKTLNRLGYAPQKGSAAPAPQTQVNMLMVSKDTLAEARLLIGTAQPNQLEANVVHSQESNGGPVFADAPAVSKTD